MNECLPSGLIAKAKTYGVAAIELKIYNEPMAHMTLDLHSIYNKGREIEVALESLLENALSKKLEFVEVITGKGSGALKKTVLRFFNRKDIRAKYWRLDIDNKNFGRLFVHFKHNKSKGKA